MVVKFSMRTDPQTDRDRQDSPIHGNVLAGTSPSKSARMNRGSMEPPCIAKDAGRRVSRDGVTQFIAYRTPTALSRSLPSIRLRPIHEAQGSICQQDVLLLHVLAQGFGWSATVPPKPSLLPKKASPPGTENQVSAQIIPKAAIGRDHWASPESRSNFIRRMSSPPMPPDVVGPMT